MRSINFANARKGIKYTGGVILELFTALPVDRFLALPEEKKKNIIDAGLQIFGKMGYKKASVSDIATAAGISKAMIFHYFGSKKTMYLYLLQYTFDLIVHAIGSGTDPTVTDFFDRIIQGTHVKLSVIRRHPALISFATSFYYETDPQVAAELSVIRAQGDSWRGSFVLTDVDRSKFKASVQPELVLNILVKYAEGYVSSIPLSKPEDVDALLHEFTEALTMMRNNFYKEEFL